MQREEVDYLLDTVSRLVSSHCDFRVRLEATEKAVRAQSGCSPVTSNNTVSIVQDTDDPALSGNNESEGSDDDAGSEDNDDVSKAVVTPLAKVRLEEIKQGASRG
ncbi:hypothetical protein GGF42_004602 [Coemansia sp. RSA 2424]|nr:hypothetical protein GGF42_004602 [Coemansia sp. RSA 2424]